MPFLFSDKSLEGRRYKSGFLFAVAVVAAYLIMILCSSGGEKDEHDTFHLKVKFRLLRALLLLLLLFLHEYSSKERKTEIRQFYSGNDSFVVHQMNICMLQNSVSSKENFATICFYICIECCVHSVTFYNIA